MIGVITPRPSPIIGFMAHSGRYVCRDQYCLNRMAGMNDVIDRIVKATGFDMPRCDYCGEHLNYSQRS